MRILLPNVHPFLVPDRCNSGVSFEDWAGLRDGETAGSVMRDAWDCFILPYPCVCILGDYESVMFISRIAPSGGWGNLTRERIETVMREGDIGTGIPGTYFVASMIPQMESSRAALGEGVTPYTSVFTYGRIQIKEEDFGEVTDDGYRFVWEGAGRWGTDGRHYSPIFNCRGETEYECYKGARDECDEAVRVIGDSTFTFFLAVQHPRNFIVRYEPECRETRPLKKHPERPPGLGTRPVYISLQPKDIRRAVGLPDPEPGESGRAPHERRAHLRRLQSDHFRHKQGHTVPVKACWVGPSSGRTPSGREYRVLLD